MAADGTQMLSHSLDVITYFSLSFVPVTCEEFVLFPSSSFAVALELLPYKPSAVATKTTIC